MESNIFLFIALAIVAYIGRSVYVFISQYRTVRATGLRFVVVPFVHFETWPRILMPIWKPIVSVLPASLRGRWAAHAKEEYIWSWGHNIYNEVGADTYILLTLGGTMMFSTNDPDVIMQVTSRKNDFWKPDDLYWLLETYGKNVITTEGQIWRRHRRVVGPPFNERNNHLVWEESLRSSQAMIRSKLDSDGQSTKTIDDLMPVMGWLALSVISKAGYGVRMDWPDRDGNLIAEDDNVCTDPSLDRAWVDGKTNGHTLSYGDAIYGVSHYMLPILITPRWLLKVLPFETTKKAYESFWNWNNYMREMIAAKTKQVGDLEPAKQSSDLLANLIKNSADPGKPGKQGEKGAANLNDEEVIGNTFLMILAGHETSAGALQHLSLMLAMNIDSQRQLQKELDETVGNTKPSEWDYDREFPRLFAGMPGAVLAETLRLISPALSIFKKSTRETDLMVEGKLRRVPARVNVELNINAAQRNPKYWKTEKRDTNRPVYAGAHSVNPDNDLSEFKPQRWLLEAGDESKDEQKVSQTKSAPDEKDVGFANASDNAATQLKPQRGTYLPYMEGNRACMGKRFAQVEIMAIIAVIFQTYSVELAVDKWASDEEVARMSTEEKKALWFKTLKEAEGHFKTGMASVITHKMLKGQVPVRFVKRGTERFPVDLW